MPRPSQGPNKFGPFEVSMEVLRGALILRLIVERKGLTWNGAAKLCSLTEDRLKKIARGESCPLFPDVRRIEDGLGLAFKADDWEVRGWGS